jgi:hypothetical protein
MASTPLYKELKANGTSFYAFPGAAEDISAAYQNQNYKMYFSKYVLINLPKQNLNPGTNSNTVYWDFENSSNIGYGFQRSVYSTGANTYQDSMVESLRNYVANYEVSMKESRLNNTEYYYDNNVLATPTEKIFWKWCKKLNLIDFEPANNGDEYFGNLAEFERNNLNDDTYFPEILWREREVIEWTTVNFISGEGTLDVEFEATTNFRVGDTIEFGNITDSNYTTLNSLRYKIVSITDATSTNGQIISLNNNNSYGTNNDAVSGTAKLVYHRLVQYVGEVNGINNVQEANRSYTEVYAHIPDHTGQTPDILFRTKYDSNYKPNEVFPILPSQYQPEIIGAANDGVLNFSSPIVSSPTNYPGSYYGQFDTEDFTYETATGDYLRRSGDYYGISGDINTPIVNVMIDVNGDPMGQSTIDGVAIDFDSSHYVKMNIIGREITNFDQFNALEVNNQPPSDFEFNAILWYYTVEDINGNQTNNLYGISFVDNPDNNSVESEIGLRVPLFKKLAANDLQDGVSYAFSLNLNFNIINDNPQDTYNPEAINSLFSFNLFNEAMRRLGAVNQSFLEIINSQGTLEQDILNMKQLLYSQTDFQTINSKIANLENLLKLYSTNQIVDSETISVTLDNTLRPPRLTLNSKDATYNTIYDVLTADLYNVNGAIPYIATVPENKNFLIYVENNDTNNFTLPNSDKLIIVIDRDLDFKQSCDIIIEATSTATQNKQLEVYIKYKLGSDTATPVETKLLETIDLPIYYNTVTQLPNSAKSWNQINFSIDLDKPLQLNTGGILEVPIFGSSYLIQNSFKSGDTFKISDFTVGTTSQIDFSGQYKVDSVGLTNSYVYFNVNNNSTLINYGASYSLPYTFNATASYELSNVPYLKLNKGIKYKITRIAESMSTGIEERYIIEKEIR